MPIRYLHPDHTQFVSPSQFLSLRIRKAYELPCCSRLTFRKPGDSAYGSHSVNASYLMSNNNTKVVRLIALHGLPDLLEHHLYSLLQHVKRTVTTVNFGPAGTRGQSTDVELGEVAGESGRAFEDMKVDPTNDDDF